MDPAERGEFEAQLISVTDALATDPENQSLVNLKQELEQLLNLADQAELDNGYKYEHEHVHENENENENKNFLKTNLETAKSTPSSLINEPNGETLKKYSNFNNKNYSNSSSFNRNNISDSKSKNLLDKSHANPKKEKKQNKVDRLTASQNKWQAFAAKGVKTGKISKLKKPHDSLAKSDNLIENALLANKKITTRAKHIFQHHSKHSKNSSHSSRSHNVSHTSKY